MKNFKYIWVIGLFVTLAVIIIPLVIFIPKLSGQKDDPWANVPIHIPHTDHSDIVQGPFETGSDVTKACLECHQDAAFEIMQTAHWTWESQPYMLEDREGPITVGKKNSINNFCIGIQSNWPGCTSCHAGYGWEDANFDFSSQENFTGLHRNYPNPFSQSTTIEYRLEQSSFVNIYVFDQMGRMVEQLESRLMPEGLHRITWDASSSNPGIYFYKIQFDENLVSGRMIHFKQ